MTNRLSKPLTIITGASRGIGEATAIECVNKGHHVVAIARTIGALDELADQVGDENITLVPEDITNPKVMDTLGPALFEKFGVVDDINVIGNAAMLGTLGPIAQSKPSDWDKVFQLNTMANVNLIRAMHPIMAQAKKANIVFVTSSVGANPRAYWGAYAASKAALDNIANTYAQEVIDLPIAVHIFDPGRTATRMRAQAYPGENPDTIPSATDTAKRLIELLG